MTYFAKLTDRGILAITGCDALPFLQSSCTNNMLILSDKSFVYTCILNNKGKFMFDVFCIKHNNKILLDVSQNSLMDIAKHLHKYAVGQQVEFHDMTEDFNVWGLWGKPEKSALPDPRLATLGQRIILQKSDAPKGSEKSLADYTQHRLNCKVPDGAIEGAHIKIYPAELGLDHLNGVSYEKGCYVGQEVTARLHFKTQPKKRIFFIHFEGDTCPHGTDILCKNKSVGTLFTNINGQGLALLKTKYAHFDADLTVNGSKITEITLPDYIKLG